MRYTAGMEKNALILFAHGARDPNWALPIQRVRTVLLERSPELRVELAFLEWMSPDLMMCVRSLVSEGYRSIVVLPMFIAQGGHLRKDVPLLLDELRKIYPEVRFVLSLPVGESELVVRAVVDYALAEVGVCLNSNQAPP